MNSPNEKPARYSTIRSIHIGKPERRRHDRREDDAGRVAGDAVDGAADALLPQRRGELLMLAGTGLLVGEHVQEGGRTDPCRA